jgi:alpha-mannosidase
MVKARFPIAAGKARTILYETPFAVTARPEGHYCAQTWAGIQDKSGGVAIINRGTAGYYAADTTLDLVLMRSAADHRGYHAPLANEHGDHVFEYALYSYAGRWEDSELIELAHSYNAPLCAREVVARNGDLPRRGTLLETAGSGAEWVAVKGAERGGAIVLRGYETRGRETTVRVKLPPGCKEVWTADLLEQPLAKLDARGGEVAVKFGKWEIVTLLFLMHPERSDR